VNIQKVLLVDDDAGLRTIGEMSLQCDWDVVLACDGEEALKQFVAEKPDLVLLDMMMPGMDGLETLRRLRELSTDVPVIFLTAKVQSHEIELYKGTGVSGVITKPFNPMTLPDDIRTLLAASVIGS
jgi:CheY-like chemotaxis protein